MINAFMSNNELHAVYVLQREGMTKIRATGVCTAQDDDKLSIYQLPDWAFDGRAKYGDTPVCTKCAGAVSASMKVPPK